MYRLLESSEDEARADAGGLLDPDLVYGYAEYCARRGAESRLETWSVVHEELETPCAWIVGVREGGKITALPGRMYGLLPAQKHEKLDLDGLYRLFRQRLGGSFRVTLPPTELGLVYARGHKGKIDRYHSHLSFLMQVESVENAWNQLKRVGRQGVRKAEKSGLVVSDAVEGGAVMRYLALHVSKNQRRESPAMTRTDVENLKEIFGEGLGLRMASMDGKAVAAVLYVKVGEYAMLIDNASLPEYWKFNPNNLVVWEAIRGCVQDGAKCIDFGFSKMDDKGGIRFKEHMGGTAAIVYGVTSG